MKHDFWRMSARGLLMGIGCILPGVSGGVMAVSFGLYQPMLDALLGFFKDWRRNLLFLLPLALGIALGIAVGAVGLKLLMERYETQLLYLFIGLILGGVPGFLREANEGGFRARWLWAFLGGLAAAFALLLLERGTAGSAGELASLSPIQAVATGAIMAIGTVVPGISTSFLLIYLGWYPAMLSAFSAARPDTLAWILAGAVLCALLTLRLIRALLERYHGYACYAALGFLLVSTALVFPGLERGLPFVADLLLLILGGWVGWRFGQAERAA